MKEKRLIDAYTLTEEIESLKITVAGKPAKWNDAKHSVLRLIAEQADVDAVEVVRCKDCKHCDPESHHCDHPMSTAAPLSRKPYDFCSYGERIEVREWTNT